MRKKAKVAFIWTGIMALAIAAYLSLTYGRHTNECMLVTFQRYSDLDPYVGDVAFLNLTNTSNKPCRMFMEGNTNTLVVDTTFGQFKQSWLVQCEFSDRTEITGTNWIQHPSPDIRSNKCVTLGPHSAMVIRVPWPQTGSTGESPFFTRLYQDGSNFDFGQPRWGHALCGSCSACSPEPHVRGSFSSQL